MIFGLCSLLALVLCMVTLVVTVNNVEKQEGNKQTSEETQSKTILKGEKQELVDYIFSLCSYTLDNEFVKVNSYTNVEINDSTITVNGDGDNNDVKAISFLKNQLLSMVDSFYKEDFTGEFGEKNSHMPVVDLRLCEKLNCDFSQGLVDENKNPVTDENGNIIDGDYYFITYSMNGNDVEKPSEKLSFDLESVEQIKDKTEKELSLICKMNKFEIDKGLLTIKAKINRLTDEFVSVEINRVYNVSMDVEFINELSVFGSKRVDFEYSVTEVYNYFYVGINLLEKEISLEVGDETNLTVNAVIEDDSEYKVEFVSSNEDVVIVDEMGYVKAVSESDTPVIVTVKLEYLGKIFTDECTVKIGTSADE